MRVDYSILHPVQTSNQDLVYRSNNESKTFTTRHLATAKTKPYHTDYSQYRKLDGDPCTLEKTSEERIDAILSSLPFYSLESDQERREYDRFYNDIGNKLMRYMGKLCADTIEIDDRDELIMIKEKMLRELERKNKECRFAPNETDSIVRNYIQRAKIDLSPRVLQMIHYIARYIDIQNIEEDYRGCKLDFWNRCIQIYYRYPIIAQYCRDDIREIINSMKDRIKSFSNKDYSISYQSYLVEETSPHLPRVLVALTNVIKLLNIIHNINIKEDIPLMIANARDYMRECKEKLAAQNEHIDKYSKKSIV